MIASFIKVCRCLFGVNVIHFYFACQILCWFVGRGTKGLWIMDYGLSSFVKTTEEALDYPLSLKLQRRHWIMD